MALEWFGGWALGHFGKHSGKSLPLELIPRPSPGRALVASPFLGMIWKQMPEASHVPEASELPGA